MATPNEPSFTADTGALVAGVVDEEFVPVQGAIVALRELERQVLTSDDGKAVFDLLPPGTYTVIASSVDHESTAKRVAVVAGEVTEIQVPIRKLPALVPYSELARFTGLWRCHAGHSMQQLGDLCSTAAGGNHSFFYNTTKGWNTTVLEGTTTPTQGLGARGFDISILSQTNSECYLRTKQLSPLRAQIEMGQRAPPPPCRTDGSAIPPDGPRVYRLNVGPYNGEGQAFLALDQRYDLYVTVFYLAFPPADYTALADS